MFFSELPPELREHLEQHITRMQMSNSAFQHDIQRLFEELDKEHLVTLHHLLEHLARADSPTYAAYLTGTVAATLKHRFNVCSCGVNHDEELLGVKAPGDPMQEPDERGTQSLFDQERDTVESVDDRYRKFLQACRDYGVKIDPDHVSMHYDDPNQTPVVCKNCDQKYISLSDRMVKPPGVENCEGCVNKTKWG